MNLESVKETAAFLMSRVHIVPKIAIVLGTVLGRFAENMEERIEIPYCNIPNFPISTVEGHKGRFVFGKIEGRYVAVMQGRVHCYEGYTMQDTAFPVWVLRAMGAENIIVTNAAGAINEEYEPGDLVIIRDHIKLCVDSPLTGIGDNEFGKRFHDMTSVYTPELREQVKEAAYGMGIPLDEGVYAYMGGPQFETPAEIRALRLLGADLVGMSTVPETIVAAHTGMKVLALSCVTNYAAGVSDNRISHDEVEEIGEIVREKFELLMKGIISRIKTE